ncbi:MAG: hypothetical protein KJZ78_09170 [Bryobacteraceae bacterium]|nr:hypothetical protein [Bryobacteraceae bacterium]HEU0139600.1 hypothetical protein [Bryobacteraceae bacterium]
MQTLSLVWGILALVGMLVGMFPCLGALNWLNIPFALAGLVVSIIALATAGPNSRTGSIAGTICCAIATGLGLLRLAIGGGVL